MARYRNCFIGQGLFPGPTFVKGNRSTLENTRHLIWCHSRLLEVCCPPRRDTMTMVSIVSNLHKVKTLVKQIPRFSRLISTVQTVQSPTEERNDIHRIKSTFQDKHGLFDKVDLVSKLKEASQKGTSSEGIQNVPTRIRIGLIGMKTSLLDTILADPFVSDQSFFEEFKSRGNPNSSETPHPVSRLIKYGQEFKRSDEEWIIPTPFLGPYGRNGLEFLEIADDPQSLNAVDGCHMYISFDDQKLSGSIRNWPVYSWKDVSSVDLNQVKANVDDVKFPRLTISEINSELGEYCIELLRESPKNSTIYTKLFPQTNILEFINQIDQLISDKQTTMSKLQQSILQNIQTQLEQDSLTLKDLQNRDERITKYINQWNELSHYEFQHTFKPYVNQYERQNLPWWKLYHNADDVQQIIKQMFDSQLLNNSVRNYSYIMGQIDSFSSFPTLQNDQPSKLNFNKGLKSLPTSNALSSIKDEFISKGAVDLQRESFKLLLLNFFGLQFPVILVSIFGHTLYDFSAHSMIALGSLGLVLGFNNVSKKWVTLIESWKEDVFEKVRLAIYDENKELVSEWKTRLEEEQALVKQREEVVEAVNNLN